MPPLYFVYGTLQSPAVLTRVITADGAEPLPQPPHYRPAQLRGFSRAPVKNFDYPAIYAAPGGTVAGRCVAVAAPAHEARLDAFEGPEYVKRRVTVTLLDEGGGEAGEAVEAWAYVWARPLGLLDTGSEWDFDKFVREKEKLWAAGGEARVDAA